MHQARHPAMHAGLSEAGSAPSGILHDFGTGYGRLQEDSSELKVTAVTSRARVPAISVALKTSSLGSNL
jgi:hypothetical protein